MSERTFKGSLFVALHSDPVVLDDCQFHDCAQLDQFEMDRSITLTPAPGEFALMNYRCTSSIRPPFKAYTSIEPDPSSPFKVIRFSVIASLETRVV